MKKMLLIFLFFTISGCKIVSQGEKIRIIVKCAE